jgi:putative transport protein
MIELLSDNPLLLLFIVAAIGYFLGNLKIKGISLGVAAVLFTGLAFGAMDERLNIPETITNLGLVLFVYSIGLSSGPAFFASYKKNGVRDFLFIVTMLMFSGLAAAGLFFALGFTPGTITGAYAGSTTNTPALAGVIDYINNCFGNGGRDMIADAVLGYSFSYPMGVMGGIIMILIMEKLLKIDYDKEKLALRKEYPVDSYLSSATVEITQSDIDGYTLRDLNKKYKWDVVFGRILKNEQFSLTNYDTVFNIGDTIMMVGSNDDIDKVVSDIGKKVDSNLDYDRRKYDVRRIFVSNPYVVGKTLSSLNLDKKYNAIITRIRRGDVDMLASNNTILELGDRLRFVARREDLRSLSQFFGDSYKDSSHINLFTFGIGIALGLVLGAIEFNFGPNVSFKLGYAGGPLIVSLILGALRRTGPIIWTMPYSANTAMQQLGLILLLAGIGVTSGHSFIESLSANAMWIFAASVVISMVTATTTLFIGYKFMKMPFSLLMGIVSNQPAILDFAISRAGNRIPVFGYTMVFPIALILKIAIAQLLFVILL